MHSTVSSLSQSTLVLPSVKASHAGTYVCQANSTSSSTGGDASATTTVNLLVTGIVPYFSQSPLSYVALATLPDAYLSFDLEVSFKPEAANGKLELGRR